MRISDRAVLFESAVAVALGVALAMVLSPDDAGLGLGGPHLLWLAVLVMAARYGTRGLMLSLPLGWGMVAGAAALLGQLPTLVARAHAGADLSALAAAVLVAWVASVHERRITEATVQLAAARDSAATERVLSRELQDALGVLRSRTDRLELSLTFLREVATRMETGDDDTAAGAALELARARTGARAGVVELGGEGGEGRATLAWNGAWSADGGIPDLSHDRVVAAVLRYRRPVRAIDLGDATSGDSDLAVPLLDGQGGAYGVMAVRGVPDAGASLATLHDLGVVAHWLSRTLARNRSARWRSRGAGEQDATEGEPAAAKRRAPPGGGGRDLERAEVGI